MFTGNLAMEVPEHHAQCRKRAATKRTLEPIYEAVFEDRSYGYRPGSNQHKCLDALGRAVQQGIHLGSVQTGSGLVELAYREHPQRPESMP